MFVLIKSKNDKQDLNCICVDNAVSMGIVESHQYNLSVLLWGFTYKVTALDDKKMNRAFNQHTLYIGSNGKTIVLLWNVYFKL